MRAVRQALKSKRRLFVIDYYRYRKNPAANPEVVRRHIPLDRDDVVRKSRPKNFT